MNLRVELKLAFDQTDNGGLYRYSDKCREIFRNYPQDDFIEKMQAQGNADVEVQGQYFQFKRSYDVHDKESLRKFMLEHGTYGIDDGEKLYYCYKGVMDDMQQLVDECWVREVKL